MSNPSPDECRCIWRKIVLQSAIDPSKAKLGGEWLLWYADRLQPTSLQHANSLYVALNLFLFGYGSAIFRDRLDIDVFKRLDDISRYFIENGNQSKQFSPVHKMAHVWGTAAVAFHLASDQYRYLVCASIIRVSVESLDIRFLSSGIESLYILARTHAPDFFNMMAHDPGVKLTSPQCINYFRRQLENNTTCIQYSIEAVNQFVLGVFNIDQTDYRV
jgi:hypothetical protein